MNIIKEFHVLVGLPGSGKTTYASKLINEKGSTGFVINFEDIKRKLSIEHLNKKDINMLRSRVIPYSFRGNILIVDGLFLTQKDVEYVINIFNKSTKFGKMFTVQKWIIDYWFPDIDACMWNEKGCSGISQKDEFKQKYILEELNMDTIRNNCNIEDITIRVHHVEKKPKYIVMAVENGLQNKDIKYGKFLCSSTWSLGGEGYSWDGEPRYISPEEPCEFVELDELLENICPTITFLHYKKIMRECVSFKDRDSSDYYSNTREAFYACDLEKLYGLLIELDYIKPY